MQVGDLVRGTLTEQLGIIITDGPAEHQDALVEVMWTTQGDSLFGPGHKEWCMKSGLEVLNAAR